MRILVLGSGGREHALTWRLARDPEVSSVVAAPGNPGMAQLVRCCPVDLSRPHDVARLAEAEGVDLTVVGPEAPLELGLADLFRSRGLAILGPSRSGAALECSKVFSKHFMARHGIPTAGFAACDSADAALAEVAAHSFERPLVIKADGLAAGKGVVIAETRIDAEAAVRAAMLDGSFGGAGSRLVLEECLTGPEVSAFFLCDGQRAVPLSTAQDHKRVFDDDRGPNTGGMGAFSPSPLMRTELAEFTRTRVVESVLRGMREAGEPYVGFLYVSLMLTPEGPKVIEFNVRFGDPEAQVVLPRVEGPLARTLLAAATGQLSEAGLSWSSDCCVGVALASRGYPSSSSSGQVIEGLVDAEQAGGLVFHAGTKLLDGRVVTAGGRVLTIVGRAATFDRAMATAYAAVECIKFDGMHYRRDIGRKALDLVSSTLPTGH